MYDVIQTLFQYLFSRLVQTCVIEKSMEPIYSFSNTNISRRTYVPPGHALPNSPQTVRRASFCKSSTARTSLA
jgi:hypothetical protein